MLDGLRSVQEPLLSVDIEDPLPLRRINIARLIMLYIKKFKITDPAEALQYFFFLRNLKDPDGTNLFLVCIADLAIECRGYDLIFGKLQANGIRSHAYLLHIQYQNIKGSDVATFNDVNRNQQLTFLRERAKALTNMAATIPYRMPGDTNSRLVQTEILMH